MTMLSDRDIYHAIVEGHIGVGGLQDMHRQLQPASLDLRLGGEFFFRGSTYNREGGFLLDPGEFCLGHTVETIRLSEYVAARVEGRSSWGRRGLMVHLTAGFIDPGFEGQITLEFYNASPQAMFLPVGERICQLSFYRLSSASERPYGHASRGESYNGQMGATPARK